MWVPQLFFANCQLPVCHVLGRIVVVVVVVVAQFYLFFIFVFRLFALLVQTKQISLTLGCLACKCHFSVQITQFITFHLTRLDSTLESNSQRVQQRILLLILYTSSISRSRSQSRFHSVANVFPIRVLSKLAVGVFNGFLCDESFHVELQENKCIYFICIIEVNFIWRSKQFNLLCSNGENNITERQLHPSRNCFYQIKLDKLTLLCTYQINEKYTID